MIESYFFIPGSHPRLNEKINTLDADHIIIDLEDALNKTDLEKSIHLIKNIENVSNIWIRPRLFIDEYYNQEIIQILIDLGFRNFVIPKVRNQNQIKKLESTFKRTLLIEEFLIIILVENPECLNKLSEIIETCSIKIKGIGFGSQDYCSETKMLHTYELLRYPRFIIANTAKSYNIQCIDIACMDISTDESFLKELDEARLMAYDGKFLIHPTQLKLLNKFDYYNSFQITLAKLILEEYVKLGKPSIFLYNGHLVEPPHIESYKKITNWAEKYGRK